MVPCTSECPSSHARSHDSAGSVGFAEPGPLPVRPAPLLTSFDPGVGSVDDAGGLVVAPPVGTVSTAPPQAT